MVTRKVFCIRLKISSKLLEIETSNSECDFVLGKPSRRTNNSPEKGRGLGHVTLIFLANDPQYLQNYLS